MKVGGFFVSRAFPCGTARREGGVRRGGTRCARILVITLNSPAPLPKRETAHSWHSFGCAVCLAHPLQLPFGCRIVCSVVVARHCVYLFFRRSASSNIALAVQRYAWEHSQSEPYFSGGLPRGGTPCIVVSQSPRKGLTQYDTADIALAIIVSPDTPGAPALAFGRLHHRSGRALSVVVNHSTRVSFSVFSSRNFRTYRSF